jgi:hypothetical protein
VQQRLQQMKNSREEMKAGIEQPLLKRTSLDSTVMLTGPAAIQEEDDAFNTSGASEETDLRPVTPLAGGEVDVATNSASPIQEQRVSIQAPAGKRTSVEGGVEIVDNKSGGGCCVVQ